MTAFSIDNVEQSREFGQVLPAGIFRFTIVDLELKKNSKGNGSFYQFELNVVDPTLYKGGRIIHRCTFENPNPVAVKIGHAEIADLIFCFQVKGFSGQDDLRSQIRGRDFVGETEIEQEANGRQNSRVIGCWSLGGKHRNPSRAFEGLPLLGETNRPPVIKKSSNGGGHAHHSNDSGAPF